MYQGSVSAFLIDYIRPHGALGFVGGGGVGLGGPSATGWGSLHITDINQHLCGDETYRQASMKIGLFFFFPLIAIGCTVKTDRSLLTKA